MSWTPPTTDILQKKAIMFVENRLYFCPLSKPPPPHTPIQTCKIIPPPTTTNKRVPSSNNNNNSSNDRPPVIFIRTDQRSDGKYHYQPFFSDFGPPDLGAIFRFCEEIDHIIATTDSTQRIVHVVADTPRAKSNGAFLTAAYTVLRLAWSARQAFAPLLGIYPPTVPFRDASYGLCTYTITVLDCLNCLTRAIKTNVLNPTTFDSSSYSHYSRVENGDWHWLVVDKLLACSGPHDQRRTCVPRKKHYEPPTNKKDGDSNADGTEGTEDVVNVVDDAEDANSKKGTKVMLSASDYAVLLRKHGVTDVVRLNDPTSYDRSTFLNAGFNHHDMYFTDGSVPSSRLVSKFLTVMETSQGAVAVHCKAGLGRTGTMACIYLMQRYGFTAKECIAWCRIVRPGSVVGPQQHYVAKIQKQLYQSKLNSKRNIGLSTTSPLLHQNLNQQNPTQNLRPRTSHQETQQRQMNELGIIQQGLNSSRMLQSSRSTPTLQSQHQQRSNNNRSLSSSSSSRRLHTSQGNRNNSNNSNTALGRRQQQQHHQQQQQQQRQENGMATNRSREFIGMVNTTGSSLSPSTRIRASTSVGRTRNHNRRSNTEGGGGSAGGIGFLMRRQKLNNSRDRDVNGMCRGRPKGVAAALTGRRNNNTVMRVHPHSRVKRNEKHMLPGVSLGQGRGMY